MAMRPTGPTRWVAQIRTIWVRLRARLDSQSTPGSAVPLPAGSEDDRDGGVGGQVGELAVLPADTNPTGRYRSEVGKDADVHDGGVWAARSVMTTLRPWSGGCLVCEGARSVMFMTLHRAGLAGVGVGAALRR